MKVLVYATDTVCKRRWVVERTLAWLGNDRRPSKDYEFLPATEENLIYLAMSQLMLRRLYRQQNNHQNTPFRCPLASSP